jgi:hypothetical protein
MAASSASANCLGNTEVLGWFKDVDKKRSLFALFIKSQYILRSHPAEWARENWASACEGMRDVMRDPDLADVAFGLICEILENFNKLLEDTLKEGGDRLKTSQGKQSASTGEAKQKRQHAEIQQLSAQSNSDMPAAVAKKAKPEKNSAIQKARAPKKKAAT